MTLIGILAFIFILGAAVVLHEFGHFIVAKMLGIRVETFSVGFGKRLWGRRWGTTDYRLSLIPLGGYVKLGGDESNAGLEEGGDGEEIPSEERFDLRPRWQKVAVGVAGPVMNVLTAIAVPLVLAMIIGVPMTPAPVVKSVRQGSAAEAAGIRPGDRIVSFNGREDREWEKISNDAMLSPEQPLPLVVEREGQRVSLTVSPTKELIEGEAIGRLGILPDYGDVPVIVASVADNSPAAEGGLKPGDQILKVDGEAVTSSEQVARYIEEHKEGAVRFDLQRKGESVQVVAGERRLPNGKLGFGPAESYPIQRVGLGEALSYSVSHNIEILRLTGMALGQVFSGQRSVRNTFSGPIGIAEASKKAVEDGGLEGGLRIFGFLSLNLGIFNLLPIPVLDGGMIFMVLLEGMLAWVGLKLSMTVRERIQQVGFVFLLLLMGFVIINDVTKIAARFTGSNNPPAATQQK
ncbi:MAG: RIP metalloprotease RseP [Acidobacteria bacterium]|nr:RIP metalloprotease RseP [Acidobacteriota bacterium]